MVFFQGADPNGTVNYDGRRPLHIACLNGNLDVVNFLLSKGASVHVQDMFNRSPLDDAIKFRHKEVVKRLNEAGAILNKKPFEVAAEVCSLAAKNRVDDLFLWTLAGADLNVCDYDGRTPLHVVSPPIMGCLCWEILCEDWEQVYRLNSPLHSFLSHLEMY